MSLALNDVRWYELAPGIAHCITCRRRTSAYERERSKQRVLQEPDHCALCSRPLSERAQLAAGLVATPLRTDCAAECVVSGRA